MFVNFKLKFTFDFFALSVNDLISFTPSSYFKSCSNAKSGTIVSNSSLSFNISLNFSAPSNVGLSFIVVSNFLSSMKYLPILKVSSGGHPCIVEIVTFELISGDISKFEIFG